MDDFLLKPKISKSIISKIKPYIVQRIKNCNIPKYNLSKGNRERFPTLTPNS